MRTTAPCSLITPCAVGTIVDVKYNDLWAFDIATLTWENLTSEEPDVVIPEVRDVCN